MDAGDNSYLGAGASRVADSNFSTHSIHYNASDSENELDGNGTLIVRNPSTTSPIPYPPPRQFPSPLSPSPRYLFPFDTLRVSSMLNSSPSTATAQTQSHTNILDTTIAEISTDLDGFSNSPRLATESDPQCTSISMLVHSSMENKVTPERRRTKTPFTATQRLQEELYESLGEKPSNLAEENQLLYQTLDSERKKLIQRKGICAFMHGALMRQREKLEVAESRSKIKSEECAARLIFHTLLLQAYRRVQEQLNQLMAENSQLQKSVENLCLQLRVVRHLQNAEKERVVGKVHEIGNLKTELAYVKKVLSKTKAELRTVEQECEALEKGNAELAEEKYKMLREQRLIEDKMEMLQGSLEMEKKRSEKQSVTLKDLKKQVIDLRQQTADLVKQCDDHNAAARTFESKNWELQMLLESRGKEVIELGQNRDNLKTQLDELAQFTKTLGWKNNDLTIEMQEQLRETANLKDQFSKAQANLREQSGRIGLLENEIGRMTRTNSALRTELAAYQLANIRRRRSLVNLAIGMVDPVGALFTYFFGRPNEFIAWF